MQSEKALLSVFRALINEEEKKLPKGVDRVREIPQYDSHSGSRTHVLHEVDYDITGVVMGGIQKKKSCRIAVLALIEKLKPSQFVIDFVAKRYLAIYAKNRNPIFGNNDALSTAISAARLGASKEVAEEVIEEMAQAGWYGIIEGFAKEVLNRGLTPREVLLLTEEYANDMACESEGQEKELMRMAEKYMDKAGVKKVAGLLKGFKKEWSGYVD